MAGAGSLVSMRRQKMRVNALVFAGIVAACQTLSCTRLFLPSQAFHEPLCVGLGLGSDELSRMPLDWLLVVRQYALGNPASNPVSCNNCVLTQLFVMSGKKRVYVTPGAALIALEEREGAIDAASARGVVLNPGSVNTANVPRHKSDEKTKRCFVRMVVPQRKGAVIATTPRVI